MRGREGERGIEQHHRYLHNRPLIIRQREFLLRKADEGRQRDRHPIQPRPRHEREEGVPDPNAPPRLRVEELHRAAAALRVLGEREHHVVVAPQGGRDIAWVRQQLAREEVGADNGQTGAEAGGRVAGVAEQDDAAVVEFGGPDLSQMGAVEVVAFPHAVQHLRGQPADVVVHLVHQLHEALVAVPKSGVESVFRGGIATRGHGHEHRSRPASRIGIGPQEESASARGAVPLRQEAALEQVALDGEIGDVHAHVVDLVLRRAVQHHASDLRAQAVGSHKEVVRLRFLALRERHRHALVALLEPLDRLVKDDVHPVQNGSDEDLRQRAPEDLELGRHALRVRPAGRAERGHRLAVDVHHLHALFVCALRADLLFRAHPPDDIHGRAADIDAGARQAEGRIALHDGDSSVGIGTQQPEREHTPRDAGPRDEDIEFRHCWARGLHIVSERPVPLLF